MVNNMETDKMIFEYIDEKKQHMFVLFEDLTAIVMDGNGDIVLNIPKFEIERMQQNIFNHVEMDYYGKDIK